MLLSLAALVNAATKAAQTSFPWLHRGPTFFKKMQLTHLDTEHNPQMVDISDKQDSYREACASGRVLLGSELFDELISNSLKTAKGPIVATARIAAVMAVKKTAELIPFCHPLPLTKIDLEIKAQAPESLHILCTVGTRAKTGVEMEALQGVSAAALCIYDMCKAASSLIEISDIRLLRKTGGKSDFKRPSKS